MSAPLPNNLVLFLSLCAWLQCHYSRLLFGTPHDCLPSFRQLSWELLCLMGAAACDCVCWCAAPFVIAVCKQSRKLRNDGWGQASFVNTGQFFATHALLYFHLRLTKLHLTRGCALVSISTLSIVKCSSGLMDCYQLSK